MPQKFPFTVSFPEGSRLLGAEIGQREVIVELFADNVSEASQKSQAYIDRVNTILVGEAKATIKAGGVK